MRRPRAAEAEIVGRVHEARAEVIMPHAIGHHAAEERVVRMRDPLGELGAALGVGRVVGQAEVGGQALDGRDARGRHGADRPEHIAAVENLHDARVAR